MVLGSASPRRLELLRSLGLIVEVAPSGYDERSDGRLTPAQLSSAHADAKLAAVLSDRGKRPAVPVLTADTVVDLDGSAVGKPKDSADAARMLRLLSGREHLVHTAFALALPGGAEPIRERATARVRFYPLEDAEIDEYVATGEPLDKAGAYGIQGRAAALIEGVDGDFYTVMGLPLARFVRALRRSGFLLPEPN